MIRGISINDLRHDIQMIQKRDWFKSHSVSADYTITDVDKIKTVFVTTGASTKTITLPTAADNRDRVIEVMKVDSGAGYVTIDGEGAETIDGYVTRTIFNQYGFIRLKSNGTSWNILDIKNNYHKYINTSQVSITSPTSGTYYQPASHEITLPVGIYRINYQVVIGVGCAGSTYYGLSASLATSGVTPINDFTYYIIVGASALGYIYTTASNNHIVSVSSSTTYKMVIMGQASAALTSLVTSGNTYTTKIYAELIG